jgi:exodeoxyribonuclease III
MRVRHLVCDVIPDVQIASWNCNSIRQRVTHAEAWLREASPDVVCLQELKTVDETFPRENFESLGYNIATVGQKGFNGVAILSKHPIEVTERRLPGDEADEQARYVEAVVSVGAKVVRVASIYLPNGNPLGSEKFPYKLGWMKRLEQHARKLLTYEEPLVLAGDYNVIPEDRDCSDPQAWAGDALAQPESRQAFRRLETLGLTDALRATTDAGGLYTFWDYQAGAWQRNFGIRIDHLLLSPQAADMLKSVRIDKHLRAEDKPSDHVPIVATFKGF